MSSALIVAGELFVLKLPSKWPSMSALALGAGIENGSIDPVLLTEAALDRVSARDPHGKTFYALLADRALSEAIAAHDRARRGLRRSALDGVPIAWKDNIDAIGGATTNGSKLFQHRTASKDAAVLARVVRAGGVTLGKTALTEFAFSGLGFNPTMGSPRNPFDPDVARAPGGSSAGPADAVARGLTPLAVGTDTAGSVRIPAAWQNLVGFKPGMGTVPLNGIMPLSRSRDTVGPLARNVADAWALWALMSRSSQSQPPAMDLKRLHLLWPMDMEMDLAPAVVDTVQEALALLARQGVTVHQDALPEWNAVQTALDEGVLPTAAEGWAEWGDAIEGSPDAVYDNVRERLRSGRKLNAAAVAGANTKFTALGQKFLSRSAGFDAVVSPTTPGVAPRLSRLETQDGYAYENARALRFTRIANFLGLCAITLPCGMALPAKGSHPMPVGLMLMARAGDEAKLFAMAAALEVHLPKTALPIS